MREEEGRVEIREEDRERRKMRGGWRELGQIYTYITYIYTYIT